MIVTGASGAVGQQVACKLLDAKVKNLVLFVRNWERFQAELGQTDKQVVYRLGSIARSGDKSSYNNFTQVHYFECDFAKFDNQAQLTHKQFKKAVHCCDGTLDALFLCHGTVSTAYESLPKGDYQLQTPNLTTFNKYQLSLERNTPSESLLGEELDEALLVNVRSFVHLVSLAFPVLKAAKRPASVTMVLSNLFEKPDPKRTI